MRRNAVPAVLSSLACLLFCCPAPLHAKPTRTIPRPSARRLVLTQPTARVSRQRTPASAHAASRTSARSQRLAPTPTRQSVPVRRPTRARSLDHTLARTLDRERALAAQSAIAAADRGPRQQTRPRPATRPTPPPPPTEEAATAPDTTPNALTNVDGVLRPAVPGALPLRSIEEEASTPVLLPPLRVSSLYDSRGHLIVPKPLYGTHEILLHQNQMADRDGSDRVRDDAELLDLRRAKKLVALPENEAIHVDFHLPEDRRFSRPWTAEFLTILASDYYAAFHSPLQVDSAVRTLAVQQRLVRTNGNAAPTTGDTASPHLTGQAVDIAKGGLTRTQIAWLRTYLQPLISQGKIDVEEEFQQACFHISVYKNFLPIVPGRTIATAAHPLQPESLPERPNE